ncbi:multiple epidermal growth factor-like domains protein 6, partial [Biomphalaria glabrata]
SGSLVVDFVLTLKKEPDINQFIQVVKILLSQTNIYIGGQNVSVSAVKVNGTELSTNSTLCDIRDSIKKCNNSEVCKINGTTTYCSSAPSTSDDTNLIIGLAVGIPLFCLLCAVVAAVVCLYARRHKKHSFGQGSNDDE